MRLYRLRMFIADLVADRAAEAALRFAGETGAMLTHMDLAITYLDNGEYTAARRILQDSINEFGEICRGQLDNYQPPLIVVDGGQPNPGQSLDWYYKTEVTGPDA